MPNPLEVGGRHYLVTGAASGIGRATASLLSRLGARLSLVDIDVPALDAVHDEIAPQAPAHRHAFDLARTAGIGTLVDAIVAEGGSLHGAIHCAGIQQVMPIKTLQIARARDLLAVNTEAALALAACFAKRRVYAGENGALVFVSSVMASAGSPGAAAYATSKAALHGMARSLAVELAPRRIRVNCVAPGFVRTPLLERTERLWDDAQKRAVEALHPLGFGAPEDVAYAIAFLVADTGRWITGTTLAVDGGYLAQ